MKNITLGRYIPYDTIIHRLDPRTKLLGLLGLLICVFLDVNYLGYIFLAIVVIFLLKLSKIKILSIFKSLKPMWFMMLFLLFFNVILIRTGEVAFTIFGYSIYTRALLQTLQIVVRLALMISITTILTATTKPLDLTYGIEYFMSPLKIIKFPAHEIAMTISIALRFIPTLLEETEKIVKAQASRGVDLQQGKLKEKVNAIISLIIPLFISSFQRSEELANAMEARGYNPSGKRTRYRIMKFTWSDLWAIIILTVVIVLTIFLINNPNLLKGVFLWLE
ncbi:MAG: energy-coupling factor transporter transmembrane component T [Bacilli bacterium]|nr:energy-coupling factor transporter transmembrane component T [Bacilli bacterium]